MTEKVSEAARIKQWTPQKYQAVHTNSITGHRCYNKVLLTGRRRLRDRQRSRSSTHEDSTFSKPTIPKREDRN